MSGFSQEDKERYDRQIRVWGAEAQAHIQKASVLVCGMRKLNVEVTKNIVLAGINKITLQDHRVVTEADLTHNFFLQSGEIGAINIAEACRPRVQDLNSSATIETEVRPVEALEDSFFQQYNVILLTDVSDAQALRINALCRSSPLRSVCFLSDAFGEEALFYSDFGEHFEYKEDAVPTTSTSSSSISSELAASAPTKSLIKSMQFPSFQHVFNKSWFDIVSRFFPLSPTFVKSRLLATYRSTREGLSAEEKKRDDVEMMMELYGSLLVANQLSTVTSSSDAQQPQPESGSSSSSGGNGVRGRLSESYKALLKQCRQPVVDTLLSEGTISHLCLNGQHNISVLSCSVLGSFLSQEVIKAMSKTGEPAFNVFVFSATDFVAKAFPIK